MRKTTQLGRQAMYGLYRLAVPMSDETLAAVDDYAERWECTRTEAARALLAWAADQWAKQRK